MGVLLALLLSTSSACTPDGSGAELSSGNETSDSGISPAACLDRVALDQFANSCTPAYQPRWSEIYRLELMAHELPTSTGSSGCGASGAACHAQVGTGTQLRPGAGARGGFLLSGDAQQTHSLLFSGDPPFIDLAQPECSRLLERLQTTDASRWMPPHPSQPHAEGNRCAIVQWVLAGAPFE